MVFDAFLFFRADGRPECNQRRSEANTGASSLSLFVLNFELKKGMLRDEVR